jgi:hypothetical protein
VSADTPTTGQDSRARNDHARSAEPERRPRPAEQAPSRQQSDAEAPRQPVQTLNRADYNRVRHGEPPIQWSGEGGQRVQADTRTRAAVSDIDRRTGSATPRQAAETAGSRQPRAETANRPDYNQARHGRPPIERTEAPESAAHKTDHVKHEHGGHATSPPESPARTPAAGNAEAGKPDNDDRSAAAQLGSGEHHPDDRNVITDIPGQFNGYTMSWSTDGTRWTLGDIPRKGDAGHNETEEVPKRPPTGEELVDSADEEASSLEKARRELWEEGDDMVDSVEKNFNDARDIFQRPPTGSITGAPTAGPYFSAQQQSGMDVGTEAAALMVLGLAVERVATLGVKHLRKHRTEGAEHAGD